MINLTSKANKVVSLQDSSDSAVVKRSSLIKGDREEKEVLLRAKIDPNVTT